MLDRVKLSLKAGDGGRGAVTFRREKFVPFGGPYGGDGGKGGDLIISASAGVSTLRAFQHKRIFKAENGHNGMSKNMHGKDGANMVIKVPPGTLIFQEGDSGDEELVADLSRDGEQVLVARGGRGGWGNLHFATPTNQAPRIAQPGSPGQERVVVVELRLIADVGIIGYPNAGKSSLLAGVSAANPKIADYPFTTLEPILGVVEAGSESFILAEIPGLIEGAHLGKGLGLEFLRHAMRTKMLIHLVDGSSPSPLDNLIKVNNELSLFDASLAKRPQLVAINKIDLPEVKARLPELKALFAEAGIVPFFISAATGDGLAGLVEETWKMLKVAGIRFKAAAQPPLKVFRPQAVDRVARLRKEGSTFILVDPEVERLLDKLDLDDSQELALFNQQLERLGINKMLKSAGVKSGNTIITGSMEWEWHDEENRPTGRNV